MKVLRWVIFYPLSVLVAYAVWIVIFLVSAVSWTFFTGEPLDGNLVTSVFIMTCSYYVVGGVHVYAGARIAPSHHDRVALLLFFSVVLGVLLSMVGAVFGWEGAPVNPRWSTGMNVFVIAMVGWCAGYGAYTGASLVWRRTRGQEGK